MLQFIYLPKHPTIFRIFIQEIFRDRLQEVVNELLSDDLSSQSVLSNIDSRTSQMIKDLNELKLFNEKLSSFMDNMNTNSAKGRQSKHQSSSIFDQVIVVQFLQSTDSLCTIPTFSGFKSGSIDHSHLTFFLRVLSEAASNIGLLVFPEFVTIPSPIRLLPTHHQSTT